MKDKLNKANKIITKQQLEIEELKNQITSLKSIDNNEINKIKNELNKKDIELNQLKQKIQNNNINNNQTQNILFADKCV